MHPGPETPLWEASRSLLQERGEDFLHRIARTLKTFEPEEVHDLRVASRRLREALVLFDPCYPPGRLSRLRKDVRKVTGALGDLRNLDEAFLFFDALGTELPAGTREGVEGLLGGFLERRREEAERLEEELVRVQKGPLQEKMEKALPYPLLFRSAEASPNPLKPLRDFGRRALSERLEDVLALSGPARRKKDAEAQHRLRIAVKKFRYRLEILDTLAGDRYTMLHRELKDYQTLLGQLHDLDVFADLAGRLPETPGRGAVLEAIAARRSKQYQRWMEKLDAVPFEGLGENLRSVW